MKAFAALILTATTLFSATGCSLYSNSDRKEFNSKAVLQTQTAVASCFLEFESNIGILCGHEGSRLTTIVRVSR